jgi:hypothetical protein
MLSYNGERLQMFFKLFKMRGFVPCQTP